MKIEKFPGKFTADTLPGVGSSAARRPEGRGSSAPGEHVTLSSLSTQLHELEAGLRDADGGFDAKRVEAIKTAIRSGTFSVNPEAVADGLIKTVRELTGR